jgi:hypothetical protein
MSLSAKTFEILQQRKPKSASQIRLSGFWYDLIGETKKILEPIPNKLFIALVNIIQTNFIFLAKN